MLKFLSLALCLSAAACDFSGIGATIGCPIGDALGQALSPPDRIGDLGAVEAQISCPAWFSFLACPDLPLAVGTTEDLVMQTRTGVGFSVETSDQSIMTLTGFDATDNGCGAFATGTITLAGAGDVSLVVRDERGELLDRIPLRVQRPARLVPFSGSEPVRLNVGTELIIGAFAENKLGEELHASNGFTWRLDVDGVVALEGDSPSALAQKVVGLAPGTVQVGIELDEVSTTIEVIVLP